MVPSSRANTAALPSPTIVVSKVAHLRKGPFQAFSLFRVLLIHTSRDGEVVCAQKDRRLDGRIDDEIIQTCRFCISEKFEESCPKGKGFFEKSNRPFIGPESSGLVLNSKLLENPYGASA